MSGVTPNRSFELTSFGMPQSTAQLQRYLRYSDFSHQPSKQSASLRYKPSPSHFFLHRIARQGRPRQASPIPHQPPPAPHPAPAPPVPTAGQSPAATSATQSAPLPPSPSPKNPDQPADPATQTAADTSPPHLPNHNPPSPTGKKSLTTDSPCLKERKGEDDIFYQYAMPTALKNMLFCFQAKEERHVGSKEKGHPPSFSCGNGEVEVACQKEFLGSCL